MRLKSHGHHGNCQNGGVPSLKEVQDPGGEGKEEVEKNDPGKGADKPGNMSLAPGQRGILGAGARQDVGLQEQDDREKEGHPGQLEERGQLQRLLGVGERGADHLADFVDGGPGPGAVNLGRQVKNAPNDGVEKHRERPEEGHRGHRVRDLFILSPDYPVGGDDGRGSTDGGAGAQKEGEAVGKAPEPAEPQGREIDRGNDGKIENQAAKADAGKRPGGKVETETDDAHPEKGPKGKGNPGIEGDGKGPDIPDDNAEQDGQENGASDGNARKLGDFPAGQRRENRQDNGECHPRKKEAQGGENTAQGGPLSMRKRWHPVASPCNITMDDSIGMTGLCAIVFSNRQTKGCEWDRKRSGRDLWTSGGP